MKRAATDRMWIFSVGALVTLAVALTLDDETLLRLAFPLLLAMALPATYFPIFYTASFRWWKSHLGRSLFMLALALMLLIDVSVVFAVFGEKHWGAEAQFFIFSMMLVGMTYQCVVMTWIRIKARKSKHPPWVPETLDGVEVRQKS